MLYKKGVFISLSVILIFFLFPLSVFAACPSGMVAYWTFDNDDTNGISVYDIKGNNDGQSFSNVETGYNGKVLEAYRFNSGPYIKVPDSVSLKPNEISIAAWVKPESGTDLIVVSKANGPRPASVDDGYQVSVHNCQLRTRIKTGPWTGYQVSTSSLNLCDGQWHHIAMTYNTSIIKLYSDGTQVASSAATGNIRNIDEPLEIGRKSSFYYNGYLDEVAIFNRALSSSEISSLYSKSNNGNSYCASSGSVTELFINDSSEGDTIETGNTVRFYAYYKDSSGNFLSGATCTIGFDDTSSTYTMTEDSQNGRYYYTMWGGFSERGFRRWNVTCAKAGYAEEYDQDVAKIVPKADFGKIKMNLSVPYDLEPSGKGGHTKIQRVAGNIFAIAYHDDTSYYVKTAEIAYDGSIKRVIGSASSVPSGADARGGDFIQFKNRIFALSYRDSANDCHLVTYNISSEGHITQKDSYEFETECDSTPYIANASQSIAVIAFRSTADHSIGSKETFVYTIKVNSDGTIDKSVKAKYRVKPNYVTEYEPTVAHASGNLFLVAFDSGSGNGEVRAFGVNPDTGSINPFGSNYATARSTLESNSKIQPGRMLCEDDICIIPYRRISDNYGFVKTIKVQNADQGTISEVLDTLEFGSSLSTGKDIPQIASVGGDVYIISYRTGNTGKMITFEVNSLGEIGDALIDSTEFSNSVGYYSIYLLKDGCRSDSRVLISHTDSVGSHNYLISYELETSLDDPVYSTFSGETTNFSNVSKLNRVHGAVLEKSPAKIKWQNPVNVGDLNFDETVKIEQGFVSINATALHKTLNTTANITMRNINCDDFKLYYKPGFPKTKTEVITAGTKIADQTNVGGNCDDSNICTNIQCSNNILTFTALHFSGYASSSKATLTINDSAEGSSVPINTRIDFYAYYHNATDDTHIAGADCQITFDDNPGTWYTMTEDSPNARYNYTKINGFSTAVTHTWNVTCYKTEYGRLNATDTVITTYTPAVPEFSTYTLILALTVITTAFITIKKHKQS